MPAVHGRGERGKNVEIFFFTQEYKKAAKGVMLNHSFAASLAKWKYMAEKACCYQWMVWDALKIHMYSTIIHFYFDVCWLVIRFICISMQFCHRYKISKACDINIQ